MSATCDVVDAVDSSREELLALLAEANALIVRSATDVDAGMIAAAPARAGDPDEQAVWEAIIAANPSHAFVHRDPPHQPCTPTWDPAVREVRDATTQAACEPDWIQRNTDCDPCGATDMGLDGAEEDARVDVEGTYPGCGRPVRPEIRERSAG